MNTANLVRMANQIGAYFRALPDQEEALEGIAGHIQKFWEPRMRIGLLEFLAAHPDGRDGQCELAPLVREAVQRHRDSLVPAAARQAGTH